ncbi:GNAT family N-acetyltransferase [Brachybacterium sp. MASK1Z-5]|uniref:GNAT family N-acetyltransferase n=1 Tax=Brachybacterium halotolerans TaxID=2795215 RepID=A0ABS1B6T0_9MICO|nr:GNAT family N-acetyltransferase [Brachybacterium halotolerans]
MARKSAKNRSSKSSATAGKGPNPLGPTALVETLMGGWRPLSRMQVDGFAILRSRGVTRRANSIVPIDPPSDPQALDPALDRVSGLVRASGESVLFRMYPEHGHAAVDEALDRRGLTVEAPCEILELPLGPRTPAPDARAMISSGPLPEDWFAASWRLSPREGEGARETMHDILAGTPAVHVAIAGEGTRTSADGTIPATGRDGPDGVPADAVAVGRAALVDHGRTCSAVLNQIATDPARRREGLGTAVVRTLLAAARVQGAERALLEVETDNPAALALYRKRGFRRIGAYHYRVGG